VIWAQGCSIRCAGCWNSEMWDFSPNIILSVPEILEKICREKRAIEGVTVLGGEPLDQYAETLELLKSCKRTNISTMLFTGYEITEIADRGMDEILSCCDILITGRYDQAKRTIECQWIGSFNQEIHFLTGRYRDYEIRDANYVEIDIEESGAVTVLGFPEKGMTFV